MSITDKNKTNHPISSKMSSDPKANKIDTQTDVIIPLLRFDP